VLVFLLGVIPILLTISATLSLLICRLETPPEEARPRPAYRLSSEDGQPQVHDAA
jgi:hypothetical protein